MIMAIEDEVQDENVLQMFKMKGVPIILPVWVFTTYNDRRLRR